uniref:SCP domain-containing protein n=1 Tax=Romanomermis culicivorax TaxID=13658 RepID=A0A915L433_ROMCU
MRILVFLSSILNLLIADEFSSETPRLHHLTKQEQNIILTMHNRFRQKIAQGTVPGQPKGIVQNLTWDNDLAKFAFYYIQENIQRYNATGVLVLGDRCWYHGTSVDRVGENIGWIKPAFLRKSINSWFEEHVQYSYSPIPKAEFDGKPKTGHYTQEYPNRDATFTSTVQTCEQKNKRIKFCGVLIWARSQKIGCAIAANCLKNGAHYDMMLLCNYSPTGNVEGEYPYYNESNPKQWLKWRNPLTDPCRRRENQANNWDQRWNKLKIVVPKPYHNVRLTPNAITIYDELVGDNLQEVICNIIKNQDESGLQEYRLHAHVTHCATNGMGRKPLLTKLKAPDVVKLICRHVERLVVKKATTFHLNMQAYSFALSKCNIQSVFVSQIYQDL